MICNNCGRKVKKTDKFCGYCGEKLTPQHKESFLNKNQSISDVDVTNGIINVTIYNKDSNSGYITHKQVGIQQREEVEKYIIKQSNQQKIPNLLEKLGIEQKENNFFNEISNYGEIIGDRIIVKDKDINIVKSILYTHKVDIKREEEKIGMFIIYI